MKHLIFSLMVIASSSYAQTPLKIIDCKLTFQETAIFDSISQADIHERTVNWIASEFKNPKWGNASNTASMLVYRMKLSHGSGFGETDIDYTIIFDIKDGKARMTIAKDYEDPMVDSFVNAKCEFRSQREKFLLLIKSDLNALFSRYVNFVKAKSDW